ncbi:hypothetical protein LPN04_10405 [Rugamonas sp. A1-17]|nr:hypothetical protein [Rugamonas sp. A1-17]
MAREIKIDINKLRKDVNDIKAAASNSSMYYPYRHLIGALKLGGLRYKNVLDYLYNEYEDLRNIDVSKRINNTKLSDFMSEWRSKGMLNSDEIFELRESIFPDLKPKTEVKPKAKKKGIINLFGSKEVDEKQKFIDKLAAKGVLIESEKDWIETYYTEFSTKYSLDELVSQYLKDMSNAIAG